MNGHAGVVKGRRTRWNLDSVLVHHLGKFPKGDMCCGRRLVLDLGLWDLSFRNLCLWLLLLRRLFHLGRLSLLDLLVRQLGEELGKHLDGCC